MAGPRSGRRPALYALIALAIAVAGSPIAAAATLVVLTPPSADAATAWLSPEALTNNEQMTYTPVVAADSQGTVLAAWARSDGMHPRIETRIRPPGGSFGPAAPLSAPGASASEPAVAFDARGDAIAVWSREGRIEAAVRPPGGSFGPAQGVSPEGEHNAHSPQVVFDAQDNALIVWSGNTGVSPNFTYRLEARERRADGSYGPVQELDSRSTTENTEGFHFASIHLAADGLGDVFAAWAPSFTQMAAPPSTPESAAYSIRAAVRPPGASFLHAVTLASTAGEGPYVPRVDESTVAADPQGDALVAWSREEGEIGTQTRRIQAKIRPTGGSFEANPEEVSGGVAGASQPRVALDGNRDAVAVWVGLASGKAAVMEAERPATGGFGVPQTLSEPGVSSGSPTVAITQNDEALAAWVRGEKEGGIEVAARPSGGGFGPRLPVPGTPGPNTVGFPSLAVDGLGDAVAIWLRLETNHVVEVAGYDAAGPSLGGLSIPSHGTVGTPLSFSVSPLDVWSPLASTTWSFGDGGATGAASITHTYARRGTYPVSVISSDALGNATSASGTVTIARLAISRLRQSHRRWRVGRKRAKVSSVAARRKRKRTPLGTTFTFKLNGRARVRFAFARRKKGHRGKGRGSRFRKAGALTFSGHRGKNRVKFQGRLSRRKTLRPGTYRMTATAKSGGARSKPRSLRFTIVR